MPFYRKCLRMLSQILVSLGLMVLPLPAASDGPLRVLIFLSRDCPVSQEAIPELNEFAASYAPSNVGFIGYLVDPGQTNDSAEEWGRQWQVEFPLEADIKLKLARRLLARATPEVFLVDAKNRVLYRGAINDRYLATGARRTQVKRIWLKEALDDALAGRKAKIPRTRAFGCALPPLRLH
jgi:hypothetical protein